MTTDEFGYTFESIGVGRGFEKIVSTLRGAIVRGDLPTGYRLPSEPELATQLGVSRPMLREALKALEVSGYLEVRRGYGGGRFVAAPEAEEFVSIKAAPLSTLDVEPRHVMDVRLAIEPMAARLAAAAHDSMDLGRALRKLGTAGTRPARVVDALVQYHLALVESSENPVFVAVYDSLRGPIAMSLGQRVGDPAWCAASRERLTHLMRLVDDGEVGAAERAVRRYLLEYQDDRGETEEAR
ncbi:FadR/GntR family transcriptional regulator [Pseudonocardia endophytica]|uniref:GntR family transcriptional regulator n=1 Tax=Pseudonocardia endophytica TaxID=401976 RepID=A0A4R1HYM4_PSEEN|nr:GntR family transcriptional regulator [Pseudonocardia endophytica]TCK26255.1 GntR family transcriptional regulator [Pseudonocardia endophytica]